MMVRATKREIGRHRPGSRAQDAEIDGQPFDAVHHEVDDAIPLFDSEAQQGAGRSVGLAVESAPGDLGAPIFLRFPLDQGDLIGVHSPVAGEDLGDQHRLSFQPGLA
jgi:hypothetical protein